MPAPGFLFFAPTAFQFEQITQVTVDICTKGGAAEVFINSKLRIYPLIWLQLVEKSGLCISESCLVGESTFEGGVTVFIAVTNTTFELFFEISLYIWTSPLELSVVFFSFFSPSGTRRHSRKTQNEAKHKSPLKLRGEQERSRYERGRCGVLRVAEKVSSWKKVETLRKCTLYPICYPVKKQPDRLNVPALPWTVFHVHCWAQWRTCVGLSLCVHFNNFRFCPFLSLGFFSELRLLSCSLTLLCSKSDLPHELAVWEAIVVLIGTSTEAHCCCFGSNLRVLQVAASCHHT